jgi:hypothetical protein
VIEAIARLFQPMDVIIEIVRPIGEVPERESICIKRYRWRWQTWLSPYACPGWVRVPGVGIAFWELREKVNS